MAVTTVSSAFADLPVTMTDEEFEEFTGKILDNELEGSDLKRITEFLDRAHESLYYSLIYKVGGKAFKDRLITANLTTLQYPLKMCLVAQINYMLDAGGDYGSVDGSNTMADGSLNLKTTKEIKDKIVAPKVYTILRSCWPNLLLGVAEI